MRIDFVNFLIELTNKNLDIVINPTKTGLMHVELYNLDNNHRIGQAVGDSIEVCLAEIIKNTSKYPKIGLSVL